MVGAPWLQQVGGVSLFVEGSVTKMGTNNQIASREKVRAKGEISAREGLSNRSGNRRFVPVLIEDAFADVKAGIKFWKTICKHSQSNRGHFVEFL
jgi:hypothetical protein